MTNRMTTRYSVQYRSIENRLKTRIVEADSHADAEEWVRDQPDCEIVICSWVASSAQELPPEPWWWRLLYLLGAALLLASIAFVTYYYTAPNN